MNKINGSKTDLRTLGVKDLQHVRGGAYEAYLTIEFEKQGKNKGTSTRETTTKP